MHRVVKKTNDQELNTRKELNLSDGNKKSNNASKKKKKVDISIRHRVTTFNGGCKNILSSDEEEMESFAMSVTNVIRT